MYYEESDRKKRKIATIGLFVLFLVVMVGALVIGIRMKNEHNDHETGTPTHDDKLTPSTTIKIVCQSVDYTEACETSLNSAASNTSDPKELIRAGFEVTSNEIKNAMEKFNTLKEVAHEHMEKQALESCQELMDYAIQDLNYSFNKLGSLDLPKIDDHLEDLKVWLSGSVNFEQTCLDGFHKTSVVGPKMKEIMKTSQHLTSNSLAMVSEFGTILKNLGVANFTQRKLMDKFDGMPSWLRFRRRNLLKETSATINPDVVVAKDGSGKYKTINEALKDVTRIENKGEKMFVIYIKEGIYDEIVILEKSLSNVMFLGDGPTKTKITGRLNYVDGTNTYRTATVAINSDNFMAKDIGFENSSGPNKHQAVALRVSGDKAVFYNCRMDGYQDTLYAHNHRQFYRDCTITGTIDFIFGDASSFFQNCQIMIRKPLPNQQCIVTAQGRIEEREVSAIILQNCTISGDPEYVPVKNENKAYLGRPWKKFSRTIIMQSHIDDIIAPEGFLPWDGDFALNTLVYAEYRNRGIGADTSKRVKWNGIKKYDNTMIESYTAAKFFGGNVWIPLKGVPYTAGLIPGL